MIQLPIPRVELLPDRPAEYRLRDWRKTALDFDRLVFDEEAKGPYLPLVWRVPGVPNLDVPGLGMPTYVGNERQRGQPAEAVTALGALLGATVVGRDKRAWVELAPQYLSEGLILNNVGTTTGQSFWYEIMPSVLFAQLSARHPLWTRGRAISKGVADRWIEAADVLKGDFDHTAFDFRAMKAADNGKWREPDAAAGVAYLELMEGLRSGEPRYLDAARHALGSLQKRRDNPAYEVLMPFGALAAAVLNAERGERWDVPRFVDWSLEPSSPYRLGWGMVGGGWGGDGLIGSNLDFGGYGFAMNSFVAAGTLAPVARYDDRLSAALAKWVLNLAANARRFYPDELPETDQSGAEELRAIPYEGLKKAWEGRSPYAAGDAKGGGWAATDLGLYGGGVAGLLGALVKPTNVPMILRLDLRATDFLPVRGYPTELIWNPYEAPKTVRLAFPKAVRPYDAVGNRFLAPGPVRSLALRLGAKQAVQVVQAPPGPLAYSRNKTLVGGLPIDYDNGRVPLPPRVPHPRPDASVAVPVGCDWSAPMALKAGAMRAELRFRWDASGLGFRLDQTAPSTEIVEAPSSEELKKHWWDFEAVVLSLDPGRDSFAVASVPDLILGWSSRGIPLAAGVRATVAASGTSPSRRIEGRVLWSELRRACGVRGAWRIGKGSRIGVQPLTIDGTFRRQAYLGGAQYAKPNGWDANSRTLALR